MKRSIAYKVRIKDLVNGEFVKDEVNYVKLFGRKVSRVNVTGMVIDKYESDNYSVITIEDEAKIRVKFFDYGGLEVNQGDLVKVIGKIRETEGERFILGEAVKKITEEQKKVHDLECLKSEVEDLGSVE